MPGRRLRNRPAVRAKDVPRAPRPVPASAVLREYLVPLATGFSWMAIGVVALVVTLGEGLPPPERANLGAGVAWLVGLSLVSAGAVVFSWALVRSTWWSRLQRNGLAADATVAQVTPVSWLRIGGRSPLDVELEFADGEGRRHRCRLRMRRTWRDVEVAAGDPMVVIHPPHRPEQAVLYWKR